MKYFFNFIYIIIHDLWILQDFFLAAKSHKLFDVLSHVELCSICSSNHFSPVSNSINTSECEGVFSSLIS